MRPRSSDLIQAIFPSFRRVGPYNGALILGETEQWGRNLFIIAQQKPKPEDLRTKEDLAKLNHGMLTAEDHSHVVRFLKRAANRAAQGDPASVITLIDTYGADISMESARHFQAFFIGHLIRDFLTIPVPTVSVIIGEGGSGGALAIQMTDRRAQFDYALYATAPPESLAAIIFRDASKVREALLISKPTAAELLELGIIDHVLPSPKKVADVEGYARPMAAWLEKTVRDLGRRRVKALLRVRRSRAKSFGVYRDEAGRKHSRWTSLFRLTPLRRKAIPTPDLKTFGISDKDIPSGVDWGDLTDPVIAPERYVRCGDMSLKAAGADEPGCGKVIPLKEFMAHHYVCPNCGTSRIMGAMGWISCLTDPDSFEELNREMTAHNLLHSSLMTQEYIEFLAKQDQRTPFREALVTGEASIFGHPVALAIC